MNKKVIIFSVIGIVIIALGVVGALYLFKQPAKTSTVASTPTVTKTTVDTSKDYGACTLLTKSTIQSTIGAAAAHLQGPDNLGRVFVNNGDESQICIYGFVTGGTLENSFNIANGFSDEIYIHKDQASVDAAKQAAISGILPVSGLGDSATYYTHTDTTIKKITYVLMVYSKLKHYTYTISVPLADKTFTSASAEVALKTIAATVTY
jgi:hypothetical protein